jgi:hypothetical protein
MVRKRGHTENDGTGEGNDISGGKAAPGSGKNK